jgi:hypothetical protein
MAAISLGAAANFVRCSRRSRFISNVKTRQNSSNLPGSKNRFWIARSTRASNF